MGHTPGPWEVDLHSDTDEVLNVVSERSEEESPDKSGDKIVRANWIAELDAGLDFDMSEDERIEALDTNGSNARLIAAAPELLEALYVLASDKWVERSLSEQATWLKKAHAAIAKAEGREP